MSVDDVNLSDNNTDLSHFYVDLLDVMSTCQIMMSTCQNIKSACQISNWSLCWLVKCYVDLSDNVVVNCMAFIGKEPFIYLFSYKWISELKYRSDKSSKVMAELCHHTFNVKPMVEYYCHDLSDNNVDLSDLYVALSVICVDWTDN